MFEIKLSEQDYKVVILALGELPAKVSMGVIADINAQVKPQINKEENDEGGDE